jgi:predicted metal-binding membrane protein
MTPGIESLLRRDRAVVVASLVAMTALAWLHLFHMAGGMAETGLAGAMSAAAMKATWGPGDIALVALMWIVMMVGMMLPSAAPMMLVFATIHRRRGAAGGPAVSSGVFLAGYLAVWTAFSVAATLGQWGLQTAAVVSAHSLVAVSALGGVLLVAAGLWQLTPLKYACLARCQSPLGFILTEWREGARGAFVMGLRHGSYCVGCCWALMGLLFVAGMMNLAWVAGLAAFVLVEKLVPYPRAVSWTAGVLLVGWGLWMLRPGT